MTFARLTIASMLTFCILSGFGHGKETLFRVLGVQKQVLLETSYSSSGKLSNKLLEKAIVDKKLQKYQGSDRGVNSINELGSALEVLSDTQMNAYGWCYRVDGKVSDLLADQHLLTGQEQQIEWFYAYAYFEKDEWKSMCIPADHMPVQE
jgi:hypothetical protein